MPQIFRPYADSVARATLVTLLLGPFAIAACLLDHAIQLHHYITTSLIRPSRSTSQCRSVTPITAAVSASTAVTATPG